MGKCLLLDNSMFDDGSVECKNYQVCRIDNDDAYVCEYDWLVNNFNKNIHLILSAIANDAAYVNVVGDDGIQYEVSWD